MIYVYEFYNPSILQWCCFWEKNHTVGYYWPKWNNGFIKYLISHLRMLSHKIFHRLHRLSSDKNLRNCSFPLQNFHLITLIGRRSSKLKLQYSAPLIGVISARSLRPRGQTRLLPSITLAASGLRCVMCSNFSSAMCARASPSESRELNEQDECRRSGVARPLVAWTSRLPTEALT